MIELNEQRISLLEVSAKQNYLLSLLTSVTKLRPFEKMVESITTGLNPRKNFKLGMGRNYYVTIKNMDGSNVILDERCDKVDDAALSKISARSRLAKGDVLFSGIGTIGRTFICYDAPSNWNVSESVFVMKPKAGIPSEFLYETVSSKEFNDFAYNTASGAAQKGIRMADLKAHIVPLLGEESLEKFNKTVSPLLKEAHKLRSENHLLAIQKSHLLTKYFGSN